MQSNSVIRLFFAGDFCSKPSTSFITPSDELKSLLASCDCRVVNFEVPLKPDIDMPKRGTERYFQNDDVPDFLRGLGFDLFTIANNHTFDWGEEGYKKTKAALGDAAFGAGTYEEAYKVKVVEIKGIKIGFLALSYALYTWPLQDTDERKGLGCAYINDLKVNHIIMGAKKEVDYLFILPHDGIEYLDAPKPETIARYRDFIDYGADGVFGSHPHCPQGWEEYKGKPIFYSLGNFFFNSKKSTSYRAWDRPHWYEGCCVVLSIDGTAVSWEVINTRNIDNIALVIDHRDEAVAHNENVCELLWNRESYYDYLLPKMKKRVESDMRKLIICIMRYFVKGEKWDDQLLLNILRNDLKRSRMLRILLRRSS